MSKYNYGYIIILFSLVSYLNGFFAVNVANKSINATSLPDIGFQLLPHINSMYSNLMLVFFVIYYCLRFFRKKNSNEIARLIWCLTILFSFRLVTFLVTHFPPATSECIHKSDADPIIWNVVGFLMTKNFNSCLDYMFSGHVIYLITLYLSLSNLSKYLLENIFFFLYITISIITIIASRLHYTVDVMVAIILSGYCYNYYALKDRMNTNK